MKYTAQAEWQPLLLDPTGQRQSKPRQTGKTMVIDKGIGMSAYVDMLEASAPYIDMIKIGFGTSPLYPINLLQKKIGLAKEHDIVIYPGGTFLEVAVVQQELDSCFDMIRALGFNGLEVSDGTIELGRPVRNRLIEQGRELGLTVLTEYGKKAWGSKIEIDQLIYTIHQDVEYGAEMVIVEGRESGKGVGLFDAQGDCEEMTVHEVMEHLKNPDILMWEAPLKNQQVQLMKMMGSHVNLGNIGVEDVYSLECLRRGLRSDTFVLK